LWSEQSDLTAGARGGSGSKAGSFRQCRQQCDGPKHAAYQHLLQEQIRLQRSAQGVSKNPVCSLTEPFSAVLCLLNCCACGRRTLMHHLCEWMKRLLCNASGTNSSDSVIALFCFSNQYEREWMALLKAAEVHAACHCMHTIPTSAGQWHSHFLGSRLAVRQQKLQTGSFACWA